MKIFPAALRSSVLFAILFVTLLSMGCGHHEHGSGDSQGAGADSSPANPTTPKDTVARNYFPVADYLRGEIRIIDSTPAALIRYTTQNNRTDSSFINAATFNRLAEAFLGPGLDSTAFASHFKESSFADATNNSVTFNYTSLQPDQALKRVDVVLDHENNDRIKSIYMEQSDPQGDTLVSRKLLWNAGRNFLIITTRQVKTQKPAISQLKVVWDSGPAPGSD